MRLRWAIATVAVLSLVLLIGCSSGGPKEAEPIVTPTTAEPPPEVVTRPEPSPAVDQKPDPLSGDLEAVNREVQSQGLLGDVFFDFDRYELKAEARERLAKNAQFLNSRKEFIVTIEGHCDERGTNEYNLALGERRANSARQYLMDLGVDASRLKTITYGEERPVCSDANESCWAQNRRGHFLVTGRSAG